MESEVSMNEKRSHRRYFGDEIPEDVRAHFREARQELRESMKTFLPPGFIEHRRKARREMLLAWRSLIDAALDRMDRKEKEQEETV
jgi:hypothetical protein